MSPALEGWHELGTDQFGTVGTFSSVVSVGGTTVVSGEFIDEPAYLTGYLTTWATTNGTEWTRSDAWKPTGDYRYQRLDLAPFADGFLAFASWQDPVIVGIGGTDYFVSRDGLSWSQLGIHGDDGYVATLITWAGDQLIETDDDMTGHGAFFHSVDGENWYAPVSPVSDPIAYRTRALGAFEGRAIAVVVQQSAVEVWSSDDGDEWTRNAELPGSTGKKEASSLKTWLATGPSGLEAVTFDAAAKPASAWSAWHSDDAFDWQRSQTPPRNVTSLVAHPGGFFAAGYESNGPCCANDGSGTGQIWTSTDGLEWSRVDVPEWTNLLPNLLQIQGPNLAAFTTDQESLPAPVGAAWVTDIASLTD